MAERKTKYTNADLVERKPLTTRIERNVTPTPVLSGRPNDPLDALIKEGVSVEDLLADAKDFLGRPMVADYGRWAAEAGAAERRALEASNPLTAIKDAVDTGAVIGSLVPSPIQPLAAGYTGIRGAMAALEDPSLTNIGTAALGALPASRLLRGARELPEAVRKSGYISGRLRQIRPSEGGTVAGSAPRSFSKFPLRPEAVAPRASQGRQSMRMLDAENLPDVPELRVVDDVADVQIRPSMGSVDELLGGMRERLSSVPTSKRVAGQVSKPTSKPRASRKQPAARPSPEFVHPADTTGGQFGFNDLPEISEGELSRLQNLFKRVTGR